MVTPLINPFAPLVSVPTGITGKLMMLDMEPGYGFRAGKIVNDDYFEETTIVWGRRTALCLTEIKRSPHAITSPNFYLDILYEEKVCTLQVHECNIYVLKILR